MATYPAFGVDLKGSKQQRIDDLAIDMWPNGGARGRSYFTLGRKRWTLLHGQLAEADRLTLEAFYDTNRGRTDVSFVSPWDGFTYNNILITMAPDPEKLAGPYWNVRLEMRQVS